MSVAPFWKGESFAKTGFGHMRPQHDAQHTHYIHQLIIVWPMCRPSPIFVPKNCVPRLQWQALAQRSGRTMSIIEAIFRIPTGGQHGYVRCVARYCRSFVRPARFFQSMGKETIASPLHFVIIARGAAFILLLSIGQWIPKTKPCMRRNTDSQ